MEKIDIKLDGKLKSFMVDNSTYSTNVNGYAVKRLVQYGYKSMKVFFASFNEKGEYLDGSFTCHGLDHGTHLLVCIMANK